MASGTKARVRVLSWIFSSDTATAFLSERTQEGCGCFSGVCTQKGGFQKGGFGGCSPGTKTGTRVRSPKPPFYETALLSFNDPFWGLYAKGWFPKGWFRRMFPRNENRNEGTFAKTTLLETALLSFNDLLGSVRGFLRKFQGNPGKTSVVACSCSFELWDSF